MKPREGWDGTFDGLTEWEKAIAWVGFDLGRDISQKSCEFSKGDIEVFTVVLRGKCAELSAAPQSGETPKEQKP